MQTVFITGASSGIGKALAAELLKREGIKVVGISRTCTIEHDRYEHLFLDLSDKPAVEDFEFPLSGDESSVVLINNAGWLGEVKPFFEQEPDSFERTQQINLIAPASLIRKLGNQVGDSDLSPTVINISSGAGKYPVHSWSGYCTSKAGLDILTRVLDEEYPKWTFFSISPGIVDTSMQDEIRTVPQSDFPDLDRFIGYHEKGELTDPQRVAKKLIALVEDPSIAPGVVFSLRDINL